MDASDHSRDLLELAVVAARSPLVGCWSGILVVLLMGTRWAASYSVTSSASPAPPTAAAASLATEWAFAGNVADDAADAAAVQADSFSPALLPDG